MCESQNQDIVVTKFVNVVWRSCESVYDWKNYLSQFIPSFFQIVWVRFGVIRLRAVKFCCLCIST